MGTMEARVKASNTVVLIAGGVALACAALGAGVFAAKALVARGTGDMLQVLSARPGGERVFVNVGSVTSHASVTGSAVEQPAADAIRAALGERAEVTTEAPAARSAARGARGSARGHTLDANVQSIQTTGDTTRVTVSIVVSSYPGRAYEFESSTTVTLLGGAGATPEGITTGVRRAMRSATLHAVDQMVQGH